MHASVRKIGLLVATFALGVAHDAAAAYITPASATGTGTFSGSPTAIIDGIIPARGTTYNTPGLTVSWTGPSTSFTVDFGAIYPVGSLTVGVDNNDDYLIQSSTDGVNYTNLFTFLASDGPVQGGLDILSTSPSYPSSVPFPGDSTTPVYVGRGFAPTNARYLRISASGGDSLYGISEIDAFTPSAVPEPPSLMLASLALLAGVGYAAAKPRPRSAVG